MKKVLRLAAAAAVCAIVAVLASAAAASASVDVYPFPGSGYEMPEAQIAFRGIPASQIGTVTVVGSKSGAHSGTIEADSDGDGGSWIPAEPFSGGETVTVTTSLELTGAPNGTFTFRIAYPAAPAKPEKIPRAPVGSDGIQHFHSRPDLTPPSIDVTTDRASAKEGDFFLAPQFGPTQNGPMILNSRGRLVWFHPVPIAGNVLMTDFQVQTLGNRPVLTWWQGTTNNGSGSGEGIVFNQDYQLQQVVKAADGLSMDLHEFDVTNSGDAYFIAVEPVWLSGVHRPVEDGVIQEIDMATGLVLFDWNALDHVPLSQSIIFGPKVPGHVEDPFHLNSVQPLGDGSLLVSARNTSSVYKIDRDSGATIWTLGGNQSTFKMEPGASFALQHDAVAQPDGSLTIFDDGAGPPRVHNTSRGIRLGINLAHHTAFLMRQYGHSPGILADFEGSVQPLADGNVVLGWGQQPYFSEDSATGKPIFDAHFVEPTSSYRAYRFAWGAQPATTPAIAAVAEPKQTTQVYASWNGATDVSGWRVLTGPSAKALHPTRSGSSHGFETGLTVTKTGSYYQVQALSASGHVLASSAVVHTAPVSHGVRR